MQGFQLVELLRLQGLGAYRDCEEQVLFVFYTLDTRVTSSICSIRRKGHNKLGNKESDREQHCEEAKYV